MIIGAERYATAAGYARTLSFVGGHRDMTQRYALRRAAFVAGRRALA